jgi:hypothetical protein
MVERIHRRANTAAGWPPCMCSSCRSWLPLRCARTSNILWLFWMRLSSRPHAHRRVDLPRRGQRVPTLPAVIRQKPRLGCRMMSVSDLPVASMQQLLPVGRDASGGSWRRLIQWVMVRRRKLGAVVVELLVAIVVEPLFFRLVTGDPGMSGRFGVGGGVLAGRVVAAPDVAALRAPAQVKPPSALLFTLHAARAGGRDSGVDARIFRHLFHETRQNARVQ